LSHLIGNTQLQYCSARGGSHNIYGLEGFVGIYYSPLLLIVKGIKAIKLGIKGTEGLN